MGTEVAVSDIGRTVDQDAMISLQTFSSGDLGNVEAMRDDRHVAERAVTTAMWKLPSGILNTGEIRGYARWDVGCPTPQNRLQHPI